MKKLTLKFLITLVLITSIIYLSDKQETYQYQQAVLGTGDSSKYLVSRVIDGDTVELATGEIIRYIGIDTPESVKPNTPVECYSKEASKRNKELVEGKYVTLEKDKTNRGRFGRLLRYVYVDDVFVNEVLVEEGYAISKTYKPDTKHQLELDIAEAKAQKNNVGLWANCKK